MKKLLRFLSALSNRTTHHSSQWVPNDLKTAVRQILLVLLLTLMPLSVAASERTEIKFFALNPSEYVGKEVELEGQIRASGPGDSWFVLEDSSGKVLVTTARLGEPLLCEPGSYGRIRGKLMFLGEEFGLYFSLTSMLSCDGSVSAVPQLFARLLEKAFALAERYSRAL